MESASHKETNSRRNDHNMSHAVPHAGLHMSSVSLQKTACVRSGADADKWTRTPSARIRALNYTNPKNIQAALRTAADRPLRQLIRAGTLMPSACEIAHENVSQCCYGYRLFTSKRRGLQSIKTHTRRSQYISRVCTVFYTLTGGMKHFTGACTQRRNSCEVRQD